MVSAPGSSLRERTAALAASSSQRAPGLAMLWVVGVFVLVWACTYGAGGSKTVLPHAFYVPVVLAAVRFGARGALVVAVAAGLAAGPLMPLDVESGTSQSMANWGGRLAFFLVIGQLVAYLAHHSAPSLTQELSHRRLRTELKAATVNGELRLVYQPVVDLSDGSLVGVEALIRWDHPEYGEVPPDDFIERAEAAGCIGLVTRFVIAEACSQLDRWRAEIPLDGDRDLALSVNVSALDLADAELPGLIAEVLERHGIPNHWLHLEVTETALVTDLDAAVDGIMRLRMLGLRIAIDDFGTGESSLASLHRFPADVVKIDRFFVRNLDDHSAGLALAKGVVALARTLGLGTVVEGVETAAQARALRAVGCSQAQGYLFARPLGPEDITELLVCPERFAETNRRQLALPSSLGGPATHPDRRGHGARRR